MKLLVLILLLPFAAAAQCTLPPAPLPGVPDAILDAMATQNGPGWTGGDGTYSLKLPDGRVLWMWSDFYIAPVPPSPRFRPVWLFPPHTSLPTHDPSPGSVPPAGNPPQTT